MGYHALQRMMTLLIIFLIHFQMRGYQMSSRRKGHQEVAVVAGEGEGVEQGELNQSLSILIRQRRLKNLFNPKSCL